MPDAKKPTLEDGVLIADQVTNKINAAIEKGPLATVHAIIVHQTGGASAASAFSSYAAGNNGAHFLIDRDGTIYQTAHTTRRCWHVGEIQSQCYKFKTCTKEELQNIKAILFEQAKSYGVRVNNLHKHESAKPYPDRFPTNDDSIGIELVAKFSEAGYDPATPEQNASLAWLVSTLDELLGLTDKDIFRHSEIGYKQPTEASSAQWR